MSLHTSSKSHVAVWVQTLLPNIFYKMVFNKEDPWHGEPSLVPNKNYKTDLADDELLEPVASRIMQRLATGIRKEIGPFSEIKPEESITPSAEMVETNDQEYKYEDRKKEVIRLSIKFPQMTIDQIAKRTDYSGRHVQRIRNMEGIFKNKRRKIS
jgi:hypothetical protein